MRMGIRTSVFFLALAPAALIAVLLVVYLTNTRIEDLEQSLMDRGQGIANQLAAACEYGVLVDDTRILERLAHSIAGEPDVIRVTIRNRRGNTLTDITRGRGETRGSQATPTPLAPARPRLTFNAPIFFLEPAEDHNTSAASSPDPNPAQSESHTIGQVSLELSREKLVQRQSEVIKTSLLLILGCLALATVLGQWIGRRISAPVLRMAQVVQNLRDGNLNVCVRESSSDELGRLERGINAMAAALKANQEQGRDATTELRQTLDELEAKNAELEQARTKALDASRIKSEFLANMSHEIRTPLNGVMGFITLLSKTELKQTQRAYLQTLRASAENLMVILNDILDLSKIEAGKFKIRKRPFNLREVLEDAVLLFAANAHQKGLRLLLDIEPDVPSTLLGDAPRIAQIMTNLVSNAIKFTDKGSVEVRVSLAQESDQSVTLHLKISDTGIGITPADQKRLFTAFDQVDTPTDRPAGTGLGLTISRRLVSMMHGQICVESRSGAGTIFGVSIVVNKQPEITPCQRACDIPTLIVSRDAGLSRAVSHILEFHGAPAVCVSDLNGATAHIGGSVYGTVRPRAIILDHDSMWMGHESFFHAVSRAGLGSTCGLIVLGGDEEQRDAATYSQRFRTTRFTGKPPTSRDLIPLLNADLTQASRTVNPANRALSTATRALVGYKETVRVILADDNRINRQLAGIFLDHLGVQVDEAKTGAEVLELSRKGSYDIILMDIHMPEVDGLTATRMLRAETDNPNRHTPVIALTADAMAQRHKRYLGSGFNDHLCKPITEGALQQLLGKWCPAHPSPGSVSLVEFSRAHLDA